MRQPRESVSVQETFVSPSPIVAVSPACGGSCLWPWDGSAGSHSVARSGGPGFQWIFPKSAARLELSSAAGGVEVLRHVRIAHHGLTSSNRVSRDGKLIPAATRFRRMASWSPRNDGVAVRRTVQRMAVKRMAVNTGGCKQGAVESAIVSRGKM